MKYALIVVIVLAALSGGLNKYLYDEIARLNANVAEVKQANKIYTVQIAELKAAVASENEKFNTLYVKQLKMGVDLENTKSKLAEYKHRETVVLRKPGLVQIKANKATKQLFNEISCVTGDCPKEEK
jgi:phosphoribosylaminoimidazole carboxylase (NCAIR synthetase)